MKKLFAIVTITVLFLSLFSGCATQDADLNQVGSAGGANINVDQNEEFNDIMNEGQTPQEQNPDQSGEQTPQEGQGQNSETQKPNESQTPSGPSEQEGQKPNPAETVDYTAEGWIKICSYNVKVLYYNHVNDSNGSPMSKFEAVCDELRKIDPDIVGLQELDRFSKRSGAQVDQLERLARELGYNYWHYTKTVPSDSGEYGHGIMSRFPIKKSESIFYKDVGIDDNGAEARAYSRSELKVNGKTLVFYNSHLAGKQGEQMMHIALKMEKDMAAGKYAVMTGDMNYWPKELYSYIDHDYCTMLNTKTNMLNTTYQGYVKGEINGIDNIIVTNNLEHYWDSALNTGIKTVETSASDHLPIYTYVKMK